jgi:hypothetical protein
MLCVPPGEDELEGSALGLDASIELGQQRRELPDQQTRDEGVHQPHHMTKRRVEKE